MASKERQVDIEVQKWRERLGFGPKERAKLRKSKKRKNGRPPGDPREEQFLRGVGGGATPRERYDESSDPRDQLGGSGPRGAYTQRQVEMGYDDDNPSRDESGKRVYGHEALEADKKKRERLKRVRRYTMPVVNGHEPADKKKKRVRRKRRGPIEYEK